jgi:hypothetical protein
MIKVCIFSHKSKISLHINRSLLPNLHL